MEFVTSIISQFKESESFAQEREMQPNYYNVKMTRTFPLTQHKSRHFAIFCPLGCFSHAISGSVMKRCVFNPGKHLLEGT